MTPSAGDEHSPSLARYLLLRGDARSLNAASVASLEQKSDKSCIPKTFLARSLCDRSFYCTPWDMAVRVARISAIFFPEPPR